jgi:hypothetical protein
MSAARADRAVSHHVGLTGFQNQVQAGIAADLAISSQDMAAIVRHASRSSKVEEVAFCQALVVRCGVRSDDLIRNCRYPTKAIMHFHAVLLCKPLRAPNAIYAGTD